MIEQAHRSVCLYLWVGGEAMGDLPKYDAAGPFGDPDGAREDFKRFVEFEVGKAWGGLAMQKGDLSVRVIVGGKGSGKTIYRRLLEDGAVANPQVYVFRHTMQLPPTQLVQRFSEELDSYAEAQEFTESSSISVVDYSAMFDDNLRTEQWQHLWRRAIFRSLASLFYCTSQTVDELVPKAMGRDEFYRTFGSIVPRKFTTPESIFNQVLDIISRFSKVNRMVEYLSSPLWESLESIILKNLRSNRPVCYFIDTIDEDFRHAPSEWLDCQKGLFYQVMRLLRDPEVYSGLHICICIRDIVYSSIIQSSEHATRYLNISHIRTLEWSRDAATLFLSKKIDLLSSRYLMKDGARTRCEAWLGMADVQNIKRGVNELVADYILRHTRHLPRDIVNMGNALCLKIEEAKAQSRMLSAEEVRSTVSWVAAKIGNEAIRICANHLAVSSLPSFGLKATYARSGGDTVPSDWAADVIERALRELGKDVFSYDALEDVLSKYQSNIDDIAVPTKYKQYRMDTVLWQHGLLGYRETFDGRCQFYSAAREMFFLPVKKHQYVLHPSLIDALGLRSVGKYPVAA